MRASDKWEMIFLARYGYFQYKFILFGLANTPSIFQLYINKVLQEYFYIFVLAYIDDILIC